MFSHYLIAVSLLFAGTCNAPQANEPVHPAVPAPRGHSNFEIKGICLVAPANKIDGTVLEPIIAVNGNSIAIMPYAFCRNGDPEVKYNHNGQWWGETDAGIITTIQMAHEKNLTVMIKPHLWLSGGDYTGALKFDNDSDWGDLGKKLQGIYLAFCTTRR